MANEDKAPKPPKYNKLLKALGKQRKVAENQRQKQMKFARKWYKDAKSLNKDVIEDLDYIRDFQLKNAQTDRARLEGTYYELEDEQMAEIDDFQQRAEDMDGEVEQLKADALAFKSEANQKYQAGKAEAGVAQAFSQEKQSIERALLDQGINPNSGAALNLRVGANLAEGAAKAGAGTQAADAARQEGDARYQIALDRQIQAGAIAEAGLQAQQGMVNVGRTYPQQVGAELDQVRAAGGQAVEQTVATGKAASDMRMASGEWAKLGLDNIRTWLDTLHTDFADRVSLYSAQTQRQQVEAQESSGIGGLIGAGAGVLRSFLPGFDEGGMVEEGYALGGAVGDTDVVPAKLTPGEFVVPQNVVKWKGEEYFQKLIDKAPKDKQGLVAQTGATPSLKPAQPQVGALTI